MKRFLAALILSLVVVSPAWAGDITPTGMNQSDMYNWMEEMTDAINELIDNWDTVKTANAGNATFDTNCTTDEDEPSLTGN